MSNDSLLKSIEKNLSAIEANPTVGNLARMLKVVSGLLSSIRAPSEADENRIVNIVARMNKLERKDLEAAIKDDSKESGDAAVIKKSGDDDESETAGIDNQTHVVISFATAAVGAPLPPHNATAVARAGGGAEVDSDCDDWVVLSRFDNDGELVSGDLKPGGDEL